MSLAVGEREQALTRSARRIPAGGSIDAFGAFLQALSEDLAAVEPGVGPREAVELVERKADALGLDRSRLDYHVAAGLEQDGSLGPDEATEYRQNVARLFSHAQADSGARPAIERLFDAFLHLGRELANELDPVLGRCADELAIFLGTDGEFLKLVYDGLAGSPHASRVFYLSRLSLLGDEERRVLSTSREAVFGPDLTTRATAAGFPTYRNYTWMDNGLVASQLFYLIADVHVRLRQAAAPAAPQPSFEELFLASFVEELRDGTLQERRRARGSLTLFGVPEPEVDRVILTSMQDRSFADRCMSIARRFEREMLVGDATATLVELGASGTQACLLFGALAHLDPAADVRDGTRTGLSVCLFTPDPARWGRSGPRFTVRRATQSFTLATETVKTFCSDFDGQSGAEAAPRAVAPDQQLVAYLKQLAFHRAALEVRSARCWWAAHKRAGRSFS